MRDANPLALNVIIFGRVLRTFGLGAQPDRIVLFARALSELGFASREDIDNGMKLGCGHPMGPLTLCDFIGLDVLYAIGASLYDEFKRDEYAPPPLLKRMVASGRLGRKSGRGFYDYAS